MRSSIQFFVLAALSTACDSAPRELNPYVVEVNVTEWIQALESDDLFVSEPAIDGLVALGPNVIPALEAAFERENAPTRRGVAEVLQQIDSPKATDLLLHATDDPDEEVRIKAIGAIATSGDERAVPIIERALNDPSPAVYTAAVDACAAACRSPAALRRIVEIALHDEPFVRISISRRSIRYILRQEVGGRGQAARDAISSIAVPLLESASNRQERLRAALLVADLHDTAALPALHEALERPMEGVAPSVNEQMQIQVIAALGEVGNQESVAVLRDKGARDGLLQQLACRTLEQLAKRGVAEAAEQAEWCAPSHSSTTPAQRK
jgi:HEAT repeat protein